MRISSEAADAELGEGEEVVCYGGALNVLVEFLIGS